MGVPSVPAVAGHVCMACGSGWHSISYLACVSCKYGISLPMPVHDGRYMRIIVHAAYSSPQLMVWLELA